MPMKLIEVALPLDVINREAAREKSIRHGHPSTLHLWWARRPLAACRAVLFAQLVDDPSAHPDEFPTEADQDRERQRLFGIMERLVPWESSVDSRTLNEARAEIFKCYPQGLPSIVDPFSGGGSIPLEAQRLGLDVHASDLNPVAVLITKALIELPPKFLNRSAVHPDDGTLLRGKAVSHGAEGLADDVRYYGMWMRSEAQRRIGHLYPKVSVSTEQSATAIAWIWCRTITCPNPACQSTMPLVRSFWLGKKKGKEAWVDATVDQEGKRVRFTIGHSPTGPRTDGTVGRTGARCLACAGAVPLEYIRHEAQRGQMGEKLMAVVAQGDRGRTYVAPTDDQEAIASVPRPHDAPDSELPDRALGFRVQAYGMTHHADLFSNRQLTALCTLSDLVGEAHELVLTASGDSSYADAVATYLGLLVGRVADYQSTICTWASNPQMEIVRGTFARQALPMTWDFAEGNLFGPSTGSIEILVEWIAKVVERLDIGGSKPGVVTQESAATRSFTGLVLSTDPPYYDNIGYADLADFFYVWLRRSLRKVYPDLLSTVLTPKADELIATPFRFGGDRRKAEDHFETGFSEVFRHAAQQSLDDTPMTVFYAFKQSESDDDESGGGVATASTGWEKMLEGLLLAGLQVTGTWPMRTERAGRSIGIGTNALASSIVLVCRPRAAAAGVTDRRGFIKDLKNHLCQSLRDLQSGGVAPVDLAQAAIGPGMAVFSRFAKVIESDGSQMTVRKALSLINQALDEVSAEQEGEFDEDTRWAIAWYAQNGMGEGTYGSADDLSRAKNVSVDGLVRAGLVKSGGGKVRLLERDEMDHRWDPTTDARLTVWGVTQQLIRRLMNEGEASAAELLARVGGLGDAARDLAYRLFQIADAKKWSKEAGPYNALGASWPEVSRLAAAEPGGQGSLL